MKCCTGGGELSLDCAWCAHTRGTVWSAEQTLRGPNVQQEADQTSSRILAEAAKVVNGDRQHHYGHPYENHTATAEFWSTWIWRKYGVRIPLTWHDVCFMNDLQKTSREANRQKPDNIVDKVGYMVNVEMITDRLASEENGE